ncbi:T9SS type A sorting domain-containing protein [Xanthomarina gelatinilytica]|uniref:T9SS type A sorting domain-containing protein n=1 Tax=Xanthomarina gelatinilytica TaxID=1137281 RepID=UPI003AA7FA31
MKHSYLLLLAFLIFTFAQAQIVNIPDANFKNALLNHSCIDTDGDGVADDDADLNDDGEIQVSEAESLVFLQVFARDISSLEGIEAFINLEVLNCGRNNLTTINLSSLTNLEELHVYENDLTTLDLSNLINLTHLYCWDNQLNSLNVNHLSDLSHLICANNQLSSLDVSGLINFTDLQCGGNSITSLNLTGAPNIDILSCGYNELTTLDLTGLTNLLILVVNDNNLGTLDVSTLNFYELDASNNQLESLFIKNGNQISDPNMLNFGGNPNLEYVCVDDFELNYVQTYAQYVNPTCIVNSYCSFVPGGDYFTIQGENKLDLDVNGCNVNDPYYSNLKFNITDGSVTGTIISNSTGSYSIPVQAGIHTITPVFENPTYFSITPTSVVVDFPTDASPYNQDFCVVPNGVYNDLEITILPIEQAGPGFDANYKVTYKNKGTSTLSGNIYVAFQDDVMDFVVSNPANESGLSDLLSWSFNDLLPFESREIDFTMNLNAPTDSPPLNGDDVLEYIANISSSETDETPDDNTFIFNQTVVNSFDPNDKTCLEGQTITPEQVGKFVHYLIRFENTGTADAINIVVKDEIDLTKYDVASLIPLDGSHEFETRIKNDNVLEFIFEDINLPFDDANNDGYVLFKIKTLPSLVLGDEFSNDAEIYFDYNAPIITNDELTTVAENLSIEASELQTVVSIYPNPVSDYLNVKSKESLKQIAIYDIQGRQIKTIALTGNTTTTKVDMSSLSKGVYFVKIKTELGEQTSKIIKE